MVKIDLAELSVKETNERIRRYAAGGQDIDIYNPDISVEESFAFAENFIRSCINEVSMMARCAGKTNIHSLEPEDLRAITLITAEATQIPLSGTKVKALS